MDPRSRFGLVVKCELDTGMPVEFLKFSSEICRNMKHKNFLIYFVKIWTNEIENFDRLDLVGNSHLFTESVATGYGKVDVCLR